MRSGASRSGQVLTASITGRVVHGIDRLKAIGTSCNKENHACILI